MSRWKMALLLAVAIGFTVMGVLLVRQNPEQFGGYGCAVFFGLCVLVFVWRFLSPPRLEITRQGVAWFNGRKTLEYTWKDFAAFRAYRPSSRSLSKHVGFDYAPGNPKRNRMTAVSHAMAGVDGSFGGQWELPADEIVALLNRAKAKWGS